MSATRRLEAAQRSAVVAREQAANETEKHAQLLAEQDTRQKEQLQAILDCLQRRIPNSGCNTTRAGEWLRTSISCTTIRAIASSASN